MPEEIRRTWWDKLLITICTLGLFSLMFGVFVLLSLPFVGALVVWPSIKFIYVGIFLIALSALLDRFKKNKAE
ncbi:MAG: hypothetical protein A2651_01905 [Candidatus Yanofskybacteria bacterium RIFCSPHIGHO2_01_FULL_42_12]|uniref:Uncharacterized protein n=1 Tax=Candidatus Yanofskybacteria bacterium RIFCSPLOWO2_01_FULL_42_49 TaxID=1802694 RepID=A0A1F8GDM1_9BACT|nr:MAG: hypothetical protein A2651_01905 [Candidatus Yanofskybacteria bacterium RIFCSPHIGHO2_01_FULL_42_12]OGN23467.1 MAG: hypothetical protein A2918_00210 [Candidatus Yanofskybacteria bacterium RIFCSPLOWO2_01_FULL_42_49]